MKALFVADWSIQPGHSRALGASPERDGVNFALFSAHAEKVELCLFAPDGGEQRLLLPEREGNISQGFVPGLAAGVQYGYRVHGPWAPERGHRFDAAKLLLDPYARQISGPLRWSAALMGQGIDTAALASKGIVTAPEPPLAPKIRRPWAETVIYEAHLKGMTAAHPGIAPALRGTYAGFASDAVLDHLTRLGVTAVELLPIHAFIDDRFLVERGLNNYWGYQSIGFFAPEPRYGTAAGFREMVARLHGVGIEVILDVVYNHSGEGDETGPTLAFRGIDNASYYRLREGGRYVNDTGTGNTLNLAQPMVLRMVMDSLRHWVGLGVDGFRFDLASTLARGKRGGFSEQGSFLTAIRQDPLLAGVKLIAEPWDLGQGGYRLGAFPHPFAEWNDRFRDGVRRFWRGDVGMMPEMARRFSGSADCFDHAGRAATAALNFLAAHDGFTLQDIVSYSQKHNEANREDNRDGHGENLSDNLGVEGPSADAAITAARAARKRAMLATLMLAQGTPMLLAGDELGNSQNGNNNAYVQDNATGWVSWPGDTALAAFVARLLALRAAHPVLRQARFLHGAQRTDGLRDLVWRLPSGAEPGAEDWNDPEARCLCVELRGAARGHGPEGAAFIVFNAGGACTVTLPPGTWQQALDSAHPDAPSLPAGAKTQVFAQSVQLFLMM